MKLPRGRLRIDVAVLLGLSAILTLAIVTKPRSASGFDQPPPPISTPPRPVPIASGTQSDRQPIAPPAASQAGANAPSVTSGTWTPLNNEPSFYPGSAFLLTDGTVLVQDSTQIDVAWWKLTPDDTGSYINGTWSQVASPSDCPNGYPGASDDTVYSPLYYASAVLPDGRLVVIGGEYNYDYDYASSDGSTAVWTDQGAIYDPVANRWTCITAPSGWTQIGDAQSVVLPNGMFMVADPFNNEVATLNAGTNPPTFNSPFTPPGKSADPLNDEEGWNLLPNGTVLTLEIWNSLDTTETPALVYSSATQAWSSAGTAPDPLVNLEIYPVNDIPYYEIGPAVLRPDGTVFASGATGYNDIYNTINGTWSSGPSFPTVSGQQLECADAPAALLPDGNVLIAASPVYSYPTEFFEFDGTSLTQVAEPTFASEVPSYDGRLLVLPTGQVLYSGYLNLEIYTPAGTPNASWAPTITNFPAQIAPSGANYQLTGTQFNGLSQAVAYGDDYQAATNYPLVQITNNASGHVFYARTHSHSTMAVATGSTPVSTEFDVPGSIEAGASTLVVIANGIASQPVSVNVGVPTTLRAAPTTLSFGKIDATGTSKPKKMTLTNKGTAPAVISGLTASSPFEAGVGKDTCSGQTVAPKKDCSFEVEFAPSTVASVSNGAINISYNGTSPAVTLKGDGIAVALVAPKAESFTAIAAGAIGAAKTIKIRNPATVPVTLGSAMLVGSDPGSFTISSDACSGQPLAPAHACKVTIRFTPTLAASGAQSSVLSYDFSYGANDGNVSTALNGKVK
ncbi:MAG TPA: choice-of-anchor D domain-containing protein [Candidatus Binataceae bacterium]|nr:choice-of-anchor D domain-containing protein [Candidatus Binataceae bacterium]